jgi:uncharacterized protein
MKQRETVEQFLKRAEEALFPAGASEPTTIHSRNCDGDAPLHIAALWGDRHAINCLIDAGAEVDAKGDMSNTPLYYAVMGKHQLAIEALLERGADPDALSELGFTPRTLAKHYGVKKIIKLFEGGVRA